MIILPEDMTNFKEMTVEELLQVEPDTALFRKVWFNKETGEIFTPMIKQNIELFYIEFKYTADKFEDIGD